MLNLKIPVSRVVALLLVVLPTDKKFVPPVMMASNLLAMRFLRELGGMIHAVFRSC